MSAPAPAARPTLSACQAQVLAYVREHTATAGYPPTVREIAQHIGVTSPATAQHHLRQLERKGHLRRAPGRSRALVVVEAA